MLDRNGPGALTRCKSETVYKEALKYFPDGTSRVTIDRNPIPTYVARGEGAYLLDVDGNRYLDLNNNFTTLIHGHAFAPVIEAVARILRDGSCFANPTEHEVALASLITDRIPAIEHIRFVNSGTEAVMFAIKAARAFTGKSGLIRFEGSYHGSYDWAEIGQSNAPTNWGPADRPTSTPGYRGAPASTCDDVTVLPFNDTSALEGAIGKSAERCGCILIDVMPSRAGLIAPEPDFLAALTELARRHSMLIVSDEVLNLRQGYKGAADRFGLKPDLVAAGKIIGGGFPIGAIGGSKEVMSVFSAQSGRPAVAQGGTFSANPVSMAAGLATMSAMTEDAFARLEDLGDDLRQGLRRVIEKRRAPFSVTGSASLFRIHPRPQAPENFRQTFCTHAEEALMHRLVRHAATHGILLPSGASACLSTAMNTADTNHVVEIFDDFLQTL